MSLANLQKNGLCSEKNARAEGLMEDLLREHVASVQGMLLSHVNSGQGYFLTTYVWALGRHCFSSIHKQWSGKTQRELNAVLDARDT